MIEGSKISPDIILNSLGVAIILLDDKNAIQHLNATAEQLLETSLPHLYGHSLVEIIPVDSPIFSLIQQAKQNGARVSEYGINLDTLRTGPRTVAIQISPLSEMPGWAVMTILEQTIAFKIGNQLVHRGAARSVTAMAAMLAHEIKNPLSGIRGAAQLLEQGASEDDRPLTQLICEETDRIRKLVERMEVFSDNRPLERSAVNIHRVLEHVKKIAENGFARHIRFNEFYDPSLPSVSGNKDQLIQVFLNLFKNASEAIGPENDGKIIVTTAYQHGIKIALPGTEIRMHLPLVVSIQDNGKGIPNDLKPHLFDPFVTTKPTGSGLGLALVAKIIGDHGGVIEFDSQPKRTVFKVMLPVVSGKENSK